MSLDALRAYVTDKLPVLDSQMDPLTHDEVRQVLNAATGQLQTPSGPLHEGCALFLAALKQAEQNGTMYLVALPRALASIKKLRP